ncbi:CBS domain-containing protein [Streptomyces chartreusis]
MKTRRQGHQGGIGERLVRRQATDPSALMSTPAITVHPEQRVADAARLMERSGITSSGYRSWAIGAPTFPW